MLKSALLFHLPSKNVQHYLNKKIISHCQAQFQFSASQVELSTALILIISTPTPNHPG